MFQSFFLSDLTHVTPYKPVWYVPDTILWLIKMYNLFRDIEYSILQIKLIIGYIIHCIFFFFFSRLNSKIGSLIRIRYPN